MSGSAAAISLIDSGAGADFLSGGPGNDRFVFGAAVENLAGTNVVTDSGTSSGDDDIIELQGYGIAGFATLDIEAAGADIIIHLDTNEDLVLSGIQPNQLTAADFIFV